jgi:hypothetical protein
MVLRAITRRSLTCHLEQFYNNGKGGRAHVVFPASREEELSQGSQGICRNLGGTSSLG